MGVPPKVASKCLQNRDYAGFCGLIRATKGGYIIRKVAGGFEVFFEKPSALVEIIAQCDRDSEC